MPDKKKHAAQRRAPTKPAPTTSQTRKRLSPAERRTQILDAAAPLIVEQGYLPLAIERLARAAGSSKALIYTYFPTQYDLFNALIKREIGGLATAGIDAASQVRDLDQAALLCGMLYFQYIAQSGPLLHILMTDQFMARHIDPEVVHARNAVLHRLVRLARPQFPLSRKEILAAFEMMAAIPEEAGSLVFNRELEPSVAREICHSLISSSLDALRDPDRVLRGADDVA